MSVLSETTNCAHVEFNDGEGLQILLADCFFFVFTTPLRHADGLFPASLGILSAISCEMFKPFLVFRSHCRYASSIPRSSAAARAC